MSGTKYGAETSGDVVTQSDHQREQFKEAEKINLVPESGERTPEPIPEPTLAPSTPDLFDKLASEPPPELPQPVFKAPDTHNDANAFTPWKRHRAKAPAPAARNNRTKRFFKFALVATLLAPCLTVFVAPALIPSAGCLLKMRFGMMTGNNAIAMSGYRDYWKDDPAGVGAMTNLANERADSNRTSAMEFYQEAIRINPNYAPAWLGRGWNTYNLGDTTKALADYEKAISINPKYAMAYNDKGCVYLDKGKFDLAMKYFTKAMELEPKVWNYPLDRAIVFARTNQKEKAIEQLDLADKYANTAAARKTIKYWRDFNSKQQP